MKTLNTLLIDKNKIIEQLTKELQAEREDKVDLIYRHEQFEKEVAHQREMYAQETDKLKMEYENIIEMLRMNERGAEENMKLRLEEEKKEILSEADQERQAYQKLLEEYHALEQHCGELERRLNSVGGHKRNISDLSSVSGIDISTEDHGYGSVRSTASTREKLENIDWNGAY